MGKIYDSDALGRIRNIVNMQQQSFIDSEKDNSVKEWFVLGSVAIISAVIILLVVKNKK